MLSNFNFTDFLKNFPIDSDIEKLDLSKEEDYKKFKDAVAQLKEVEKSNNLFSLVTSLFGNDLLDNIEAIGEAIHNESLEDNDTCEDCVCTCQLDEPKEYEDPCSVCEKEWCDGCQYDVVVDEKDDVEETLKRPSELTDTNTKLQIHRLVGEYSDEYIKPYVSNDQKGQDLVNNAYAGLFEFACWIYNHK